MLVLDKILTCLIAGTQARRNRREGQQGQLVSRSCSAGGTPPGSPQAEGRGPDVCPRPGVGGCKCVQSPVPPGCSLLQLVKPHAFWLFYNNSSVQS